MQGMNEGIIHWWQHRDKNVEGRDRIAVAENVHNLTFASLTRECIYEHRAIFHTKIVPDKAMRSETSITLLLVEKNQNLNNQREWNNEANKLKRLNCFTKRH